MGKHELQESVDSLIEEMKAVSNKFLMVSGETADPLVRRQHVKRAERLQALARELEQIRKVIK